MSRHEQESSYSDDQGSSTVEDNTFDPRKRITLRFALGAIATLAGAVGAYEGNEFISNLIEEKDKAVRDSKEAKTALEKQKQEKDAMLRAYREIAYKDVIESLIGGLHYDSPLSQALTAIDQSRSLTDTLKKDMLTSGYESRVDAFIRMHQDVQPIVTGHFAKEPDHFHAALSNILAYATSKGTLTVNVEDINKDQSTFATVDFAFAELSDIRASVLVPGYKDLPPVVVQTSDLFLQRLNETNALIYAKNKVQDSAFPS